jgi:hypothetical protein
MKTLPVLLLALSLFVLPLATGCFRCESGPEWERYAEDRASASIPAGTPAIIPLTISAPASAPGSSTPGPIAVEIAVTDCAAGPFELGARMLASDDTEITAVDGLRRTGVDPFAIQCPSAPVVFEVPSSELTCAGSRCAGTFSVELTSETGVGPRGVEVRLVNDTCSSSERTDAAIDAWGE